MCPESLAIAREPVLRESQDYDFLRSRGLKQVETLGHELWTDYNVHDPGVAMLELFCYAITELGLRTGYDISDLLTRDVGGVPVSQGDFHQAQDILVCDPVTFDDLRKLLIDVHGVRNAWVAKNVEFIYHLDRPAAALKLAAATGTEEQVLDGLYDVFIELEEFVDDPWSSATRTTRDKVLDDVRDRLHAHRNLCEDFVDVCDLDVEEVAVCTDIDLAPEADPEEVLAEIFYRLRQHVSPEVRFYTLDEMWAKGRSTEEIFAGPLLDHGFIDDEEFRRLARRCEIRTSDVVQIIMDVEGVEAIRSISLLRFIDGEEPLHRDWILPLTPEKGRAPAFADDRSKVVFYRNDLPLFADREVAGELLREKLGSELQTKLRGYQAGIPVPVGKDRNVERYYPAQNELPANFRVGNHRVARSEDDLRKAQSLQLKAYLLLFEQILANHLSQLANLSRLFSWRDTDDTTYFTQPVLDFAETDAVYNLDGIVATIEEAEGAPVATPALEAGLRRALDHIIETEEVRLDRRDRLLDHLLARFAEDVTAYTALMRSMRGDQTGEIIDHKRALLAAYPASSRARGTGRDTRDPTGPASVSGYERRVCRLLGIDDDAQHVDLADAGVLIEQITPGGEWRFVVKEDPGDPGGADLFQSMSCPERTAIEALLDSVIEHGAVADNYVGSELRWQCPGEPPQVLGEVAAGADLSVVADRFAALRAAEGMHVVEHVLLRKRTRQDPFLSVQIDAKGECECVEVVDPYSFRVSVVLPSWPGRFRDLRFRRFVEDTLRAEAPAHVYPKICWISHDQMRALEARLNDWRGRLAGIATSLGVCRADAVSDPLTGEPPLPPTGRKHKDYRESLEALVDALEGMVNVHPLATLYDCHSEGAGRQPITLNNTNLGTF